MEAMIGLTGFGLLLLVYGVPVRTGLWKSWYFVPGSEGMPLFAPPGTAYGAIPLGLCCLYAGLLAPTFVEWLGMDIAAWIGIALGVFGVILTGWQPWWSKPSWLRWLEQNHANAIPVLKEEFRAIGLKEWQRQTSGSDGLERWIAEVRQKRGLD